MSDVYSAIRADINNGRFTSLSWTDKDECASCGASKVHMGGSLPDAPVRWRLCWFCFMTNYRAKRERVAAPLPDFRGKPIHEGDFLFGSTNTDVIIGWAMRQHTLGPGFGWLSNEEVRWRICDIARVTGNWNERRLQPWAGHGYLLYYHNENGRCTSYHVLRQHDVQFNDRELDCRRLEKVLGICSYKPTLPRTVEHTHWCGRGKTRTAITLCEPGLYFVEFPDEDPRLLRRENIRASLLDKGMEEWRMPTDLQPADGQLSLFEV